MFIELLLGSFKFIIVRVELVVQLLSFSVQSLGAILDNLNFSRLVSNLSLHTSYLLLNFSQGSFHRLLLFPKGFSLKSDFRV